VIPTIREFDGVDKELAAFLDLPPLRDGFADATQEALQTLKEAEAALAEANERHATLAVKIDANPRYKGEGGPCPQGARRSREPANRTNRAQREVGCHSRRLGSRCQCRS
jgi:hypothetical protein